LSDVETVAVDIGIVLQHRLEPFNLVLGRVN
jgi:hypothetical protein